VAQPPLRAGALLLVALPLIDLLLLGKGAEVLLPKVRDWMTNNSWHGVMGHALPGRVRGARN
jgi:hypothetical protein